MKKFYHTLSNCLAISETGGVIAERRNDCSNGKNDTRINGGMLFRRVFVIWTIIIVTIIVAGCESNIDSLPENSTPPKNPERIISTTPSITELLFEIGLGNKIVGDCQFTTYPPETAKIEKIGGLYDRNNEKIISLNPDVVIFSVEDVQFEKKLSQLGIGHLAVDHRSISGLLDSYELVGKLFGGNCLEQAIAKRHEFEEFLHDCKSQTEGLKRLRVLAVIDRQHGTGRISNVFIAGSELFFSEVLNLAGGENVAANVGLPYPGITTEAIIDFNPDIIIDIQATPENDKSTENLSRADWDTIKDVVPAIKKGNVFIIVDNYASIPGPRIPLLIKKLREILDSCRD
ncbi:MAG: helical backbone metal receptor [Planctomycetaceae bacterium]|nr:helical backbone metal receptor [Planctomycetaceae bacterium]